MPKKAHTSLRKLRTFCVAAEHESFTLAADELFITASAVSHQVKGLEEELGELLFDRHSRELRLTETGRALYKEAGPLIEQLDEAVARIKGSRPRRSVRMSVQPFFASEYFVPRLSEFSAQHPAIDIQVGTSDESAETLAADADLAIRLFRKPPPNVEAMALFPLRLMPAGSPDFKKQLKVRKQQIISEFPLIVHDTFPKAWDQWSQAAGITLPAESKITRLDSMIAVVRACERGIGAALMPVPIADLWFLQGSIVPLFDQEPLLADLTYFLLIADDRADDPDVVLLRDWILATFTDSG